MSKLLDFILEFQGCFLICVELFVFKVGDFKCIFIELNVLLIYQYIVLMKIEGVDISFDDFGIQCIVEVVWQVNECIENIGVCCLYIVLECFMEDILFDVFEKSGELFVIDVDYVNSYLEILVDNEDLLCFIL